MNEPLNDPWFELGYLLTAIDSHQLVTQNPSDADEKLYWAAGMARKRVNDVR
jgi:hypothetical protein